MAVREADKAAYIGGLLTQNQGLLSRAEEGERRAKQKPTKHACKETGRGKPREKLSSEQLQDAGRNTWPT